MKTPRLFLSRLALAAAFAPVLAVGAETEPALAKLTECMKLGAATPEQQACLQSVEALRRAAPPRPAAASMAVSAPTIASSAPTIASSAPKAPPSAPAKVDTPPEVKQAAAQLGLAGAPPTLGGLGGVSPLDLRGMDLETAMRAMQAQRVTLLEGQLKTQIESIQQRNEQVTKLYQLLTQLRALRPAGSDPRAFGNLGATKAEARALYESIKAVGLTLPTGADTVDETGGSGLYDASQKTFDAWMEQIKGRLDGYNSSQQMEMLRLQSLTNKRNEAFEIMTNFIKKMAENRAAIIGNMR